MTKGLQVEYFGSSDTGCVRTGNEDAFAMHADDGLFVVCDGMGGGAAGEVASSLAVEAFMAGMRNTKVGSVSAIDDVTSVLYGAIVEANGQVLQRSRVSAEFHGMGTTLVAMWLRRARIEGLVRLAVWLAHVGDSRCYRLRDGGIEQMTADHSLVEQQVRMGQMTAEEAERSNMRHVITRAVGVDSQIEPEIAVVDALAGDLFLLCSDGLTREVTDARIAELIRNEERVEDACRALIAEARSNGGNDNITSVLVRVN
ncbi:MAG TPA: Stp1/IreP family PP2C-type Ser/Thr phosphatase [Acidobacteriaceae bacterium]|jgi:protein phosphatase|nr:Stp1/IreP family PP2C-type Ser/Thr phosphatase [Acidobacteriaceae bacterium]